MMTQPSSQVEKRRCGALPEVETAIRWRVWAPNARRLDLVLFDGAKRREMSMLAESRGYFHCRLPEIADGQRYAYRLNGGSERPDPCSLWQPDGVHGPSAVVRPARFVWTDRDWKGIPLADLVFYELHVGTFTPAGNFESVIPRLRELRELGITALEIMPVGQFPGTRNWGYDGVQPYAAQNSYGGPHGLQRLVDACHAVGLAIFLDVVYNHLGPEGNYLSEFGPYFTDHYKTPWGKAVNFDGPGSDAVRDYVLDNARMWLEEFHFDGLRLDAVHAIYDFSARHILRAIKETAEDVARRTGRWIHIIAESDLNDPRLLNPPEHGGYGLDAQWSDDFHHAAHAYFTGERRGYYEDFGSAAQLARALVQPFLYAGDYSITRDRKHGAPPKGLSGDRFVVCLQNHDQVGNRARGDRLLSLLREPAKQRLASSYLLLAPYLPLLFMGEEYGEDNPFPFFCSFGDPALIKAVRDGRKREFAGLVGQEPMPDPHAETTFAAARLSWSWPSGTPRAGMRCLHADLLAARRRWPALRQFGERTVRLIPDNASGPLLQMERGAMRVFFNLADHPCPLNLDAYGSDKLLFSSESSRYGGRRIAAASLRELSAFECIVLGPPTWPAFV